MNSLTERTCEYGLARTEDGCVRTLASFTPDAYRRLQCLNIAIGVLALGVSAYKYVRSVRNDGATLQRRAFLVAMYCSMTFLVRGVDPMSYGHYTPRPFSHFLVDSCTAAVYTIFIMTLSFWVSMIHKGMPTPREKLSRMKLIEYGSLACVWLFKISVNVSLVWTKGFDLGINSAELFTTAALLFTISSLFCFYGIRVMRRLEEIDKMVSRRLSIETQFETLHTSRIDAFAMSHATTATSADLEPQHSITTLPPPTKSVTIPKPRRLTKKKPARKIKEMLIVTEVVSLICIAAQIYTGIRRLNGTVELQCANGARCDEISMHWPLLHILQYVAIWCILFSFRKTKRNRSANNLPMPRPLHAV